MILCFFPASIDYFCINLVVEVLKWNSLDLRYFTKGLLLLLLISVVPLNHVQENVVLYSLDYIRWFIVKIWCWEFLTAEYTLLPVLRFEHVATFFSLFTLLCFLRCPVLNLEIDLCCFFSVVLTEFPGLFALYRLWCGGDFQFLFNLILHIELFCVRQSRQSMFIWFCVSGSFFFQYNC